MDLPNLYNIMASSIFQCEPDEIGFFLNPSCGFRKSFRRFRGGCAAVASRPEMPSLPAKCPIFSKFTGKPFPASGMNRAGTIERRGFIGPADSGADCNRDNA